MTPRRCERHDLAAGPDGQCALCHRVDHAGEAALVRKRDRAFRTPLKVVVAVLAGLATFGALLARFDTDPKDAPRAAADASRDDSALR